LKQEHLLKAGQNCSAKAGLFGAAAASAALLKLDPRKIRYVLSYCSQQASGLFTTVRDTEHIEKAYTLGGMPAHNGLAAALMVASGFTGVEDVMSGEPNFLSVFSPDADGEALVRGLGRDYEITRCAIKCWPAAGAIQGPLHVLHDLIREHGIKAADVAKLIARLPDKELQHVDNREMPSENVQHLLGVMLLDGNVTYATAHDYKRMKDPKVLRLRENCIETIGDPSLTDPLRRWRCVMEITLKDGRKFQHQTMAAKGVSENPLTREEEEERALDLMGPVLGKQRSRTLMSALFKIESIKNLRALRPLYSA
jgi:2-methylcitrate dehydratase PrpD